MTARAFGGTRVLAGLVAAFLALLLAAPEHATFPGKDGLLVFSSSRDGDADFFVQNLDGTDLRKLLDRPGTDEFNPSWSPSGERLVVQSSPVGVDSFDLYLLNADGTGLTPLLVGPTSDYRGQFCDENTVVFSRDLDATNAEVYAIETDGTGLRRLTDHPARDVSPTCSPDGTQVAFISYRSGSPAIYAVPLASAQAARTPQLAEPALLVANAVDPDYSPDGETLAYGANDGDNTEIFTKDLTTGTVTQVTFTNAPTSNRLPKFYPSGSSGLASRSLAGPPGAALSHTRINANGSHDLCLNSGPCNPLVANADSGATQPVSTCACESLNLEVVDVESKRAPKKNKKRTAIVTVTLQWQLLCTAGEGRCSGRIRFGAKNPGTRHLSLGSLAELVNGEAQPLPDGTSLVSCSGRCAKYTVGELKLSMSSGSFRKLKGTYGWRVTTLCSSHTWDFDFSVGLTSKAKARGEVDVEVRSH